MVNSIKFLANYSFIATLTCFIAINSMPLQATENRSEENHPSIMMVYFMEGDDGVDATFSSSNTQKSVDLSSSGYSFFPPNGVLTEIDMNRIPDQMQWYEDWHFSQIFTASPETCTDVENLLPALGKRTSTEAALRGSPQKKRAKKEDMASQDPHYRYAHQASQSIKRSLFADEGQTAEIGYLAPQQENTGDLGQPSTAPFMSAQWEDQAEFTTVKEAKAPQRSQKEPSARAGLRGRKTYTLTTAKQAKANYMQHQAHRKVLSRNGFSVPAELSLGHGTQFKPLMEDAAGILSYEGTRSQRRKLLKLMPGFVESPVKPYYPTRAEKTHAKNEFFVDSERAGTNRTAFAMERILLFTHRSLNEVFAPLFEYVQQCADSRSKPDLVEVSAIIYKKMADYYDLKVTVEDEEFWLSSYQLTNERNKAQLVENIQLLSEGRNPKLEGEDSQAHHMTQRKILQSNPKACEIVIYIPSSFHHEHTEILHSYLHFGEETLVHGINGDQWHARRKAANLALHQLLLDKVRPLLKN